MFFSAIGKFMIKSLFLTKSSKFSFCNLEGKLFVLLVNETLALVFFAFFPLLMSSLFSCSNQSFKELMKRVSWVGKKRLYQKQFLHTNPSFIFFNQLKQKLNLLLSFIVFSWLIWFGLVSPSHWAFFIWYLLSLMKDWLLFYLSGWKFS